MKQKSLTIDNSIHDKTHLTCIKSNIFQNEISPVPFLQQIGGEDALANADAVTDAVPADAIIYLALCVRGGMQASADRMREHVRTTQTRNDAPLDICYLLFSYELSVFVYVEKSSINGSRYLKQWFQM